jgi:uncharacterized pyridoxamine 5'-phosphate oxidase family protein
LNFRNSVEDEIRQKLRNNSNISISKIAKEFDVDVDIILDIFRNIDKNVEKNDLGKNASVQEYIPLEQEKHFDLLSLIQSGESSTLEFKGSMFIPLQSDPDLVSTEY